tara:strand:+ start:4533 stop:5483 length:951 start_codon:yes stop_codon:yes gene_type:complete
MFLVLGLFWVGLAFDFSALENFLVNMCYSYFIGFTIPQLLGAASGDSIVEQVFRLKMICTVCVVLYGGFLFYVGTLKTKKLKLQCLYLSLIIPLTSFLSYLWLKVIYEDHIISRAEKIELSQFTIFSIVTIVLLLLLSFKKEKALVSKAVLTQIPTADDLKKDMQDTSVSVDADQVNIDEDKTDTDKELEKATSNEQTKKEISDEVVDESTGDLPPPTNEVSAQVSMGDDELPPPEMDELPSDLAELKEGGESNESAVDLPPPSEKESTVSMADGEELPPPAMAELPAELAELKEDGGNENSEIEKPEIDKESSAT